MMKNRFHVNLPQSVIDDLRLRIEHVRWPDTVEPKGWNYGTNLTYLQELISYWYKDFDWRQQEKQLNRFNHFQAAVAGQHIHFIHEHGKGPRPIPIVLTHGWPSTFYEMFKIIPLLTDPEAYGGDANDAFDVVVPSLPGYGFSERPMKPGVTFREISDMWTELMVDVLGYERFAAHGGDLGSDVTTHLGRYHSDRIIGIHLLAVTKPYLDQDSAPLTEEEQNYVRQVERWKQEEGAYTHQQSTKPQTLAYGLNDSPVGLAGWIVEKMRAWSDCSGDVERRFSKDELLTNLMIYWATETINSSMRLYYDHNDFSKVEPEPYSIEVPTGVTLTVEPVNKAPKSWAERTYKNIQHWTELPRGGHFAAFEEPELLAEEIRAFFRPLRKKL